MYRVMVLLALAFASPGVLAAQMDIATFNALRRGMPESEVLLRAGPPDRVTDRGGAAIVGDGYGSGVLVGSGVRQFHYLPDRSEHDPHLTVITITNGVVSALERHKLLSPVYRDPDVRDDDTAGREPRSDEDIARERAQRAAEAAEDYAQVRARLKAEAEADADAPAPRAARPVYRGVDEQGRPYFGDVPPPGGTVPAR